MSVTLIPHPSCVDPNEAPVWGDGQSFGLYYGSNGYVLDLLARPEKNLVQCANFLKRKKIEHVIVMCVAISVERCTGMRGQMDENGQLADRYLSIVWIYDTYLMGAGSILDINSLC